MTPKEDVSRLDVTFESLTQTKRQWTAGFLLGSETANAEAALRAAWQNNARIVEKSKYNIAVI